jgi:hypothetical protein
MCITFALDRKVAAATIGDLWIAMIILWIPNFVKLKEQYGKQVSEENLKFPPFPKL